MRTLLGETPPPTPRSRSSRSAALPCGSHVPWRRWTRELLAGNLGFELENIQLLLADVLWGCACAAVSFRKPCLLKLIYISL